MASFLRLLPALIAAAPLLVGPAAWATDCGCPTADGEALSCECGPIECGACGDATGGESGDHAAEPCPCGCDARGPIAPTVPQTESAPTIPVVFLPPQRREIAEAKRTAAGADAPQTLPEQSERRARLGVWRN
ncbi:MAG: hypothetical protein AAF907_11080 [Planctomycetota bacterium]